MTRRASTNIAWVDVETSGLDPREHGLLEVACLITDSDLNILDEGGYHAVIAHTPEVAAGLYASAVPRVQQMHLDTGLWKAITQSPERKEADVVDIELHDYIKQFKTEDALMPIAGNSVHFDLAFLKEKLPMAAGLFSHRIRDVSTIGGWAYDWYGGLEIRKTNDHTAMRDIRESIREMRFYRDMIFKSQAELEGFRNQEVEK